ncbi:hypothetical protein NGM99_15230 [Mesorhizobium sp. RP14(2022)]|uniref:Periplasmic protein n=1 Tax=Mesorhizobium liriopis TaxID=2953882 RepID=A0ABT1CAB7_9HYPH|nr:hypothetical protein [Mesorhizobium liriopis]MCO6051136.1 hypothetical protein [Mesorhizobium liriopis]
MNASQAPSPESPLPGAPADDHVSRTRTDPVERAKQLLARIDDGAMVRVVFRGMLLGTLCVLGLDFYHLQQRSDFVSAPSVPGAPTFMPPDVETDGPTAPGNTEPFVPSDPDLARNPMQFTLEKGGTLSAKGSIDPGAAERFKTELDARGEYVKTVALDSPGGSLHDAIAMAKLIRERKIDTRVDDGAQCASSCPLIFVGGTNRSAAPKASLGVHQFYAPANDRSRPSAQVMADAQATTALITRHLTEMGVDPALWLHALETPPRALYRFAPEELVRYRLTTGEAPVAEASPSASGT